MQRPNPTNCTQVAKELTHTYRRRVEDRCELSLLREWMARDQPQHLVSLNGERATLVSLHRHSAGPGDDACVDGPLARLPRELLDDRTPRCDSRRLATGNCDADDQEGFCGSTIHIMSAAKLEQPAQRLPVACDRQRAVIRQKQQLLRLLTAVVVREDSRRG
jgi:hypothetical protein